MYNTTLDHLFQVCLDFLVQSYSVVSLLKGHVASKYNLVFGNCRVSYVEFPLRENVTISKQQVLSLLLNCFIFIEVSSIRKVELGKKFSVIFYVSGWLFVSTGISLVGLVTGFIYSHGLYVLDVNVL